MLYHLREKTPVMTSQVLNRCGSYQDASLRFVDDLSVGQTKCISPGQDFVIPSPSIKLDSDDFVGDQSALAMLQQANVKFVEILSHIGALFRQSIQLAIILEEALWNGKVVPAVQPYVSSRLIELVTSRTTWVWEESMGGVDVLVDEYGFIASAIAEASDTASAADLVANQVQSYTRVHPPNGYRESLLRRSFFGSSTLLCILRQQHFAA